jgi:serine/threonine protein phosphatase PrpC
MPQPLAWRAMGRSVRGASHHRVDLPNQDALCYYPADQNGPPLILAVSDGHGSAKSFRSDRGSQFAVTVVVALLQELVAGRSVTPNLSSVKRLAEERLPQELVRRWQEAVDADLAANPFDQGELARLREQRGDQGAQTVLASPRLAYGATALGVVIACDFFLFLQLGDGDILVVSDDGEVSRPFTRDDRLIANETTSLCMDRAWREVRLRFQAQYGSAPALILAATDGYANSFVNDAAFLRVGSDILEILRRDGAEVVEDSLGDWLREASDAGSGDDITVGLLYRTDFLGRRQVEGAAAAGQDLATAPDGGVSATDDIKDHPEAPAAQQDASAGDREDLSKLRSRMVAQLKHQGPREPSKQGRLRDLVDDDEAPDGT